MSLEADIAANLADIRQRIAAAAARAGRSADEITLVAVSKTKPAAAILAALAAGQADFGENRPEEAWEKFCDPASPAALAQTARTPWRLHLIGPIQSRKADLAAACQPALIHSLDRLKVARRLDRAAAAAQTTLDVLLEVNISGEASKFGFAPADLRVRVAELATLPALRLRGLMTIPPDDPDPEAARPIFRALRHLRDELAASWPEQDWRHLSMGMSHDFEVAIEEGATIVRVGTAIFGARA